MTVVGWLQIAIFTVIVGLLTRPMGGYLTQSLYRRTHVVAAVTQTRRNSALPSCGSKAGDRTKLVSLHSLPPGLPRTRNHRALQHFCESNLGCRSIRKICQAVAPDLALNPAVSFVTNTSWQSYSGETDAQLDASQMAGITVQSFLSAASGMAVAIALIRGFARRRIATIGNFWIDLTRVRALRAATDLRRCCLPPGRRGRSANAFAVRGGDNA